MSRRNTSVYRRPAPTKPTITGTEMKIAAIGAGGVNGYFGARLVQARADVSFLARGKHLAAMREKGLKVESPLRAATLKVKGFERPAEVGPVDRVIVSVKLLDTERAAQ